MKAKNIIITFVFVLWLVFFAVFSLILKDSEFSSSERRMLEQFVSYSEKKETAEKRGGKYELTEYLSWIETYLIEQFPARDTFRTSSAAMRFYLLNQSDYKNYYITDGSVCCMDPELEKDALIYNANYINKVQDTYFSGSDIDIYYSIIPDKNYFYAESGGYLHYDYNEFLTLLSDNLDDDFSYIDIFPLLSGDDYYIADPHWNQPDIIPVAQHLLSEMGAEALPGNYEQIVLKDFNGTYRGHLSLPLPSEDIVLLTNSVIENCTVTDFSTHKAVSEVIYDLDDFNRVDPYDVFLGGATRSLFQIRNEAQKNGKQLVVFRDSFGSSLVPLMVDGYSEIIVVDMRLLSPSIIEKYVEIQPDCDVLFILSTSVLNSGSTFKNPI